MHFLSGLVVGTLIVLVAITTAMPFHERVPLVRVVKRHDPFGVIHGWQLFAPEPTGRDYELWCRQLDGCGYPTPWMRIGQPWRTPWSFLINPHRRAGKTLRVACKRTARHADRRGSMLRYPPYEFLYAYARVRLGGTGPLQIAITTSFRHRDRAEPARQVIFATIERGLNAPSTDDFTAGG